MSLLHRHRVAAAALALGACGLVAAGLSSAGCSRAAGGPVPRVIILGLDGLDYDLTTRLMKEGRLPGLSRLAKTGGFSPLGTAIPAQSPVAWSDFITGHDAGFHGIFDFIHRDPATMQAYLSTSRTDPPSTFSGSVAGSSRCRGQGGAPPPRPRLLGDPRRARCPDHDPAHPANFPPSGTASRELSGMGRPTSSAATGPSPTTPRTASPSWASRSRAGTSSRVEMEDGVVRGEDLRARPSLKVTPEKLVADFTLSLDPDRRRPS